MQIEKLSPKEFSLRKETDLLYYLDYGSITPQTNRQIVFLIKDIKDTKNFTAQSTCGCSTIDLETVDSSSVKATVSYNNCDRKFARTLKLKEKNKSLIELKLTGTCNSNNSI